MLDRLIRYGIIGITGVVVNVAVLTLARRLLPGSPTVTYIIAVEASIISNYMLNAWFTFRQPPAWLKMGQYNLVSIGGLLVQTGIYRLILAHPWNLAMRVWITRHHPVWAHVWWVTLLTNAHWNYLVADLCAIPFGTLVGFLLSAFWVFRSSEVVGDGTGEAAPRPNRAGIDH
jgi:dolichol-phosphate mannosyltransferase